MIQLNATINVFDALGSRLDDVGTLPSTLKSNVSADISDFSYGMKNKYENPFILGVNKCGDGSFLYDEVKYFIGGEASDENGDFANSYVFFLIGMNLTHFTMEFDKLNNAYPTSITVDGTTYANDDTTFTVASSTSYIEVEISNWSLPNRPLIIQSIFIGLTIDVDYKNAIEISSELKSSSDNSQPTFGLLSNAGNIRFNDIDGEVKDYAEMQLLKSGCKVQIFIEDTLTENQQIVGEYITDVWDYDDANFTVSVSLVDNLLELQEINIDEKFWGVDKTVFEIFEYLVSLTPTKFNLVPTADASIKMSKILVKNAKIDSGTLWAQYQKVCNTAMLRIYKDFDGNFAVR